MIMPENCNKNLEQRGGVGFVLKKLLTYFEMLIVPHALQCVDGCFASGVLNSDLNSLAKFTH